MKTMNALQIDKAHNLMTTDLKFVDTTFSTRKERDGPIDNESQMV